MTTTMIAITRTSAATTATIFILGNNNLRNMHMLNAPLHKISYKLFCNASYINRPDNTIFLRSHLLLD